LRESPKQKYAIPENVAIIKTYKVSTLFRTKLILAGYFIEECKFRTIPLPSKSNTATPKKKGNAEGLNRFKSELLSGY